MCVLTSKKRNVSCATVEFVDYKVVNNRLENAAVERSQLVVIQRDAGTAGVSLYKRSTDV